MQIVHHLKALTRSWSQLKGLGVQDCGLPAGPALPGTSDQALELLQVQTAAPVEMSQSLAEDSGGMGKQQDDEKQRAPHDEQNKK